MQIIFYFILGLFLGSLIGYSVRLQYGEWKLKYIEKNLLEFAEYQRFLEQNKANLKTPTGKLPEYF